MSNGAASEGKLGRLHDKVATVLTQALDQTMAAQDNWNDDGETQPPEVNPQLISVAVRFLDANKITCTPEAGNALGELEAKLAAKRARKGRVMGNVVQMVQDDD